MKILLIAALIIGLILLLCDFINVNCRIPNDYFNDIMNFSDDKELKGLM